MNNIYANLLGTNVLCVTFGNNEIMIWTDEGTLVITNTNVCIYFGDWLCVQENNTFSLHDLGKISEVYVEIDNRYVPDSSVIIEFAVPCIANEIICPLIPCLRQIVSEYVKPLVEKIIIGKPTWSPYILKWTPGVTEYPPRKLYAAITPGDGHIDTDCECLDGGSFVFDPRCPSTDKIICVSTEQQLELLVTNYSSNRPHGGLNWNKLTREWGGLYIGKPGQSSAHILDIWIRRGYLVGGKGVWVFNTNLIHKIRYFQLEPTVLAN
jgi:hypothetical protein